MSTYSRLRRRLAWVVLALVPCAAGHGQSLPKAAESRAEAVALVEIVQEGRVRYGSAFRIDKSGLFVTSAEMVSIGLEAGAVNLILGPGRQNPQRVKARLVRWNEAIGLSVLKIDTVGPLTWLELGTDDSIRDTMAVTAYGFPWDEGILAGAPAPAVTIMPAHVTASRRAQGKLAQVQVDGQFTPGFSGGPLLDQAGKVVGIIQSGVGRARINFATPVGRLSELLASPLVVFEPSGVDAADRSRVLDWTVRVTPAIEGSRLPPGLAVSLTLPGAKGQSRKLSARAAGAGIYTVKVVPLAGAPERRLAIAVGTSKDPVSGVIADLPLRVDGKPMALADVQSISMSQPPKVVLRDGTMVTGEILGLGRVEVATEAGPVAIDLRRARVIHVLRVGESPPITAIEVGIEIRRGATLLCHETRRVDVLGFGRKRPVAATTNLANNRDPEGVDGQVEVAGVLEIPPARLAKAVSIRPPSLAIPEASTSPGLGSRPPAGAAPANKESQGSSALVRKLPGNVEAITPAGGGRYLLLSLSYQQKLAIFDASAGDVTKLIALPSRKFLVAGGAEKFVVVLPDQNMIERWDLATLTREEARSSPIRREIASVAMGCQTAGPMLALWNLEKPDRQGGLERYSFVDLGSLKVLKVPKLAVRPQTDDSLSPGGDVLKLIVRGAGSVEASDDGSVRLVRKRGTGSGSEALELADGVVRTLWFGTRQVSLIGPDGGLFYGGDVIDGDGKILFQLRDADMNWYRFAPSLDPRYFLGIVVRNTRNARFGEPIPVSMTIFATGSRLPLVTVENMEEMYQRGPAYAAGAGTDVIYERRFHWVPSAGLLVTIPHPGDQLCLRRLALPDAKGALAGNDLYVTSGSVLRAPAGKKLNHRIEVKSSAGGVRFTLAKGPEGMAIKPGGLIEWNVPNREGEFEETAVILIEDAAEQSLFHKLTIQVR